MMKNNQQFELFDGDVVIDTLPKKQKLSFDRSKKDDVMLVDVDLIDNHPMNNTLYQNGPHVNLRESILEYGLFDSQITCKRNENRYKLLSGHRRVSAYKALITEGLISNKPIPIHIREFQTEEEEIRFMIEMNSSSRERDEIDKLNETFAYASTHKAKEQLNNQEIVRRISDRLGLGESQLKKYMRLFDAVDWELEKARAELGKYKSVNQWDELRSKGELQLSSKDQVQKKPEHFEQDRKNGRNKVPLPANQLYAMKPSTRFIARVTKVQNAMTDLSNHFVFLIQQKDLSKQGVKRLKSIQSDLSKSKQALNEFLNEAEQEREVTE